MLNQKTTNFITNRLSNSLIKYNITNKNKYYNNELLLNFENENTASKNLYRKKGSDLSTRNALGSNK